MTLFLFEKVKYFFKKHFKREEDGFNRYFLLLKTGMKYPQLVSARAVNAISDWLVSRLERLGVDAPLVYSRLLLSLLHTPLQINALDLAEAPQLKVN